MKSLLPVAFLLALSLVTRAEDITLGTYNIEYFNSHFLAHQFATNAVTKDPAGKLMWDELRKKNDEDNWETAQVILDPKFNPDILVIEEGCDQDDLNFFNRRWLSNTYETVIQFPSNTERHQQVEMMLKPGFKVLEKRDQYYLEPDPVGNERGSRLFARGPAFVKVKTPAGKELWVGVTHMKSKNVGGGEEGSSENGSGKEGAGASRRQRSIDATKWRNREAKRTHEIMKELEKAGPSDVILLGDMNDSVGLDAYEGEGGGDAIMNLVGPAEAGLTLATQPLVDTKKISFHGYFRTGFRELIDHVVVTRSLKGKVKEVRIIDEGFARVSSDHFPVVVKLSLD